MTTETKPAEPSAPISRDDFPPVSDMRFWQVKHNPKSMAKPVTIELREFSSQAAKDRQLLDFSRLIGIITTTADRNEFLVAAFTLHKRVDGVDDVVGVY